LDGLFHSVAADFNRQPIPFGAMVAGDAAGQFDSSKRERKTWPDP
jgi:hypothetical protein